MPEMHPCPSCTELVIDGTCVCPHCGEKACRKSGVHGPALILGLTLAAGGGCWSGQAEYAATVTWTPDSADTADTGTSESAISDE